MFWPQVKWQPGRQDTGYEKIVLFWSKRLSCDIHLIRYRAGAYVDWHKDPAPIGWRHYRLNVFLKQARDGGRFVCQGEPILDWPRLQLFRPDIQAHKVTRVHRGTRYVLSVGWLWPTRSSAT